MANREQPAPHLEQRSQSGSTLCVYSSVVFSHSSQNPARTHIPDTPAQHGGEKKKIHSIFFHCKSCPHVPGGGGGGNKSRRLAWISGETRRRERQLSVCVRKRWHMSSAEVKTAGGSGVASCHELLTICLQASEEASHQPFSKGRPPRLCGMEIKV